MLGGAAHAADYRWDGEAGDDAWGANGCQNWYGSAACPSPGSDAHLHFHWNQSGRQQDADYDWGDWDDWGSITFEGDLARYFKLLNSLNRGLDLHGDIVNYSSHGVDFDPTISLHGTRYIRSHNSDLYFHSARLYIADTDAALHFEGTWGRTITIENIIDDGAGATNCGITVGTAGLNVVLKGPNEYSGQTSIDFGTLRIDNDGCIPDGSGLYIGGGGVFDKNGKTETVRYLEGAGSITLGATGDLTSTGHESKTFSGVISGSGSARLVKYGSGTLTLSGPNTYSGGTLVRDGVLRIDGSAGTGLVEVASPGSLSGTGRLANLLIRGGGLLRPGSSPGTLTATNVTWSTNGVYEFEIMDFAGAYGATNGWDKLDVQGVLTVDASANTFTVRVVSLDVVGAAGHASNFNPSLDYTLPIASVTGATALVGFNTNQFRVDASAFSNTAAGAWTVLPQGTNIVLRYSSATNVLWDATNTLAGAQDGSGVWSTTNANWWNGVSSQPWNSAAGRDAVFGAGGSGAQTVTVGEALSVGGFVFNAGPTFTIGDTNELTLYRDATASVAAASATISARLVGPGSLTKLGTGTLVLVSNNTYVGGTVVKAGALQIAQATTTPIARGPLTLGDTAGSAPARLVFANSITLTQAVTIAAGSTGTKSADSGGINPTLSGRLTLNDDFAWRMASAANATFAVINLNARMFTVTNQSSGTLSFGGAISGADGSLVLVNSGGGTITFGNNGGTFSGGTTVSGSGTLVPTTSSIGAGPTSGPFGTGPLNLAGTSMRSSTGGDITLANAISFAADMSFVSVASEKSLTFTGPGTLTGNRTLTVSIGLNVAGKGLVVSGNIGDGGGGYGLIKAGSGNLILHGTNTYTGGTTINTGNVILASSNALALSTLTNSVAQGLLFTNGTAFTLGGLSGSSGFGLTNLSGGVVTLSVGNNNADTTYGGVISGGGSLVKVGSGTLTMGAGGNSYTGTTAIRKGVIAMSGGNDRLPTTTVLTLGDAVTDDSGLFRLSDGTTARNQTLAGLLSAGAGASNRVVAGGSSGASTLTLHITAGSTSFGGILGGGGANENDLNLVKSGDGEQVLTGTNTQTGSTTVQAGILRLAGNRTAAAGAFIVGNTAGKTGTLVVEQGAFALSGTFTIGSGNPTVTGVVNQTGGTLTASGGNQVLVGAQGSAGVPNAAGIYHLSGGTLAGAANNVRGIILGVNDNTRGTFNLSGTGVVSMLGSALQVARSDAGATNSYGEFNQTGGTATLGNLSVGGQGSVSYSGNTGVLYLAGGSFSATNFLYLAAAPRAGAFLTIGGTAAVTLPAFPTTRGAGSTSQLTFDGGVLTPFAASATYISALTKAYLTTNGARLNVPTGRDITISQLLEDFPSQSGSLSKSGAGVLTLSGANSYSGDTTISNGTLAVGAAGAIPDGAGRGNVLIEAGATLNVGGFTESINGLSGAGTVDNLVGDGILTVGGNNQGGTFSGTLSNTAGTLALRKTGTGTLVLAGNNLYAGGTIVSNGTLRIQSGAGSGTGTGVVDVVAGTLDGTGRVARLLIRNAGSLSPGADGVGQLTVTNMATWSTNGSYRFEVNDFAGAAGAGIGWDHQNVLATQEVSLATGAFTVRVVSLRHDGAAGLASNFNPNLDYLLPIASARAFTNDGPALFVVDAGAFSNVTTGEWSVVQQGTNLLLWYRCTNGAGSGVEWDATNSVAGRQDGSGTWSSTNANWWNGSGDAPWNNAARRTALLGAGGSGSATLTVAEPVTARGITFQTGPVYTVSGTGVVTFVAPSTVDVSAAAATLASVVDGTAAWTKTGTGTLSLSGANLNSGGVRIEQGAIAATASNALGSGGVSNNAVLHLNAGAVTYSGLSTSLRGSGTNRVTLGTGAGTTVLNGNYGAFTGEWYIGIGAAAGAGKAQLNGADHAGARIHVLTNGAVYVSGNVTKQAAITLYGGNLGEVYGQLRLDNGANWAGPVTLAGNMTAATDGHVGLLAAGNSLGYISGNIGETDGPRSLIKSGSDTASLVLRGTNTYRGGTVILNGFVVLGTPVAITNSTVTNLVADGLQFTNATAFTLGGLAGTGGFGLTNQSGGAVTLTVGLNGESSALSGILRDAGGLIKVGTGTLTLSGVNSFSGGLTIRAGTVSASGTASALGGSGAGTVLLGDTGGSANATLLGDGRTFANPITVQAGSMGTNGIGNAGSSAAAFTAPLTLNNALTLSAGGAGSLRLSGNITGASTIQVFSAGGAFVHLNGTNNAFSGGVAIQTGLLRLDTTNALTVANPVFLNFGGTNDVRANLTLAGLNDGPDGGGTVVNGDTVDRTLTLGGSGSYAFSGDLSPAAATRIALAKAGTGTQTLSGGSSTYARGTAVTGGTLRVMSGAGSATGTGLVDVAVSGVLDGTGRVANLRLRNNGAVSPGVGGLGTLTVTNGATWATNGVYVFEISDFAGTYGASNGWDRLAVGGPLAVDLTAGVFTVRVASLTYAGVPGLASNFDATVDYTLPIATAASVSGFDGTRFVVDTNSLVNGSSGTWSVVQSGPDVVLSYVSGVASDGFRWDATNTVAEAQDGRGTWSQSDTNWWNGTASVPWNNLSGRKARFGAAGTLGQYTVTLAEAISAQGIQFVTGTTYTILGDAAVPLTLANLSTVTVSVAHTATLAAVLSGTNTWSKNGTGLLVLASNNTQRGQVVLDQGTLRLLADQTAALGGLTFGVTNRSPNAVTLNLSNANLTAGALLVQHDLASASTIRIGAGKTLSITGHVSIGASDGNTSLTITDTNGTFAVSRAGGVFSVGNGADATGTVDLGDLDTFTANLSTGGSFRVGHGTFLNSGRSLSMTLASTSTITAAEIKVGAGPNGNRGTMTLRLGSGVNIFNTDDLYVGMYANAGRTDQGTLMFDGSTGTFTLRGMAGGSARADVHVEENNGGSTGAITDGLIDLRDHTVDLLIGVLTIGLRSGGSGGSEAIFRFNSGTLDVNRVVIGQVPGSTSQNGTFDLQGGTVVINTNVTIGTATGAGSGTSRMNVGGAAAVTSALGVVVGHQTSGTLTSTLAVSNNALLAVGGHISATGTVTSALILNGPAAVLDLNGKDIGNASGVALGSFTFTTGTVRNLGVSRSPITLASSNAVFFQDANAGSLTGVVSGAGALIKQGTQALVLAAANTFAGGVSIRAGALVLTNAAGAGTNAIRLGHTTGSTGATLVAATQGTITNDVVVQAGSTGVKVFLLRANSATGITHQGSLTLNADLVVSNGPTASGSSFLYGTNSTLPAGRRLTLSQEDTDSLLYVGGRISGSGEIVTAGAGAGGWVFNSTASDYSGGTVLNGSAAQVVVIQTDSAGPAGAPTSGPFGTGPVVLNGVALRATTGGSAMINVGNPVTLSNDTTFVSIVSEHSLVLAGPITLAADRIVTADVGRNTASAALRFAGVVGDGGLGYGLTVSQSTNAGSGRLVLSASNTYTGVTRILPFGQLQLGDLGTSGALAPASAITNDGRLAFGRTDTLTQGVHFASNIAGTGTVRQLGGGTLVLNAANTFSGGFLVQTGTVRITDSGALGVGPKPITISTTNGVLQLDGSGGNLSLAANLTFTTSVNTNWAVVNLAGTNTVSGTLQLTSGFGNSRIASTDGRLIWAGPVTNITTARTFGLDGASAESNAISGRIVDGGSGALSVAKHGTGTWVLTGANTYTGSTSVTAGKLVVTTAATNGGGNYTVSSGAWLGVDLLAVDTHLNAGNLFTLGDSTLEVTGYPTNQAVAALEAGTLAVNGTVTVYVPTNLVATEPDPPAEYPLIAYAAKSGSGSFALGTPVGPGVVASIEDTGTNIVLRVGSAQPVEWYGDKNDTWNIADTNWKRGSNHDRKFSSGISVTFDDTLTNHPDVNVRTVVSPAAVVFSNSATAYSLSGTGRISGATGLVKYGTNVVALATTNLFTGPTTLYEGVLAVARLPAGGVSGALGRASADATNLVLAGGTLRYTGPAGGSDRLFSVGTNGGVIEASGSGALSLTNAGALGFNGESGPRTLTLGGTNQNANRLTATLTDNGGATALHKTGPGTWWLQGANSHGGATTVGEGVLDILTDTALGTTAGGTVVSNGATLQLEGPLVLGDEPLTLAGPGAGGVGALYSATDSNTVGGPITLAGDARMVSATVGNTLRLTYTGALAGAGYTVTLAGAGDAEIEGGIGPGAGGLNKDGAGRLTLYGVSAFGGGTVVSGGTLAVQGELNRTGTLRVAAGALLSGTGTVGMVTVNDEGQIQPGGSIGVLRATSLQLDFGSQLIYEFETHLSNDHIRVAAAGGLVLDGGVFTLYEEGSSNRFDASGRYNLISYSNSYGGDLANLSVSNRSSSKEYIFGNHSSNITLTIRTTIGWDGSGENLPLDDLRWSLSTNWADGYVPTNYDLFVFGAATKGHFNTNDMAPNTVVGGLVFLSDASDPYVLDPFDDTRVLNLAGGITNLSPALHVINIPLAIQDEDQVVAVISNSLALNGVISEAGGAYGLRLVGEHTLTLTGTNRYSGTTQVGTGTLQVNNGGGSATGSGRVDVFGAGTLTGTGRVSGLQVAAGGTLSPGAGGPAVLMAGATTWGTNGVFRWEVNDFSGAHGDVPGRDRLLCTGVLTIAATAANAFTVQVASLTYDNGSGVASNFVLVNGYTQILASASDIIGFDAAKFQVQATNFHNPYAGAWSIERVGGTNLALVYAPVLTNITATTNGLTEPSFEAGIQWAMPTHRNVQGNPNSGWKSYAVFYTYDGSEPTTNSAVVVHTNGPAALTNVTATGIGITNLSFDTEIRMAAASLDKDGRFGPISAVVTQRTADFAVTQGVVSANSGVLVRWAQRAGVPYDVLYQDAAGWTDALTNSWQWLATVTNQFVEDLGEGGRPSVPDMSAGLTRFYRVTRRDLWQPGRAPRTASREIYVARNLRLMPGENWYSLPAVPDDSTIAAVFGTNRLPAAATPALATRISWYGGGTASGGASKTAYLSTSNRWVYSLGGTGVADTDRVALAEGFALELPGTQATGVVVVGRLTTNSISATVYGGNRFNLLSYAAPNRPRVRDLGLREAGFRSAAAYNQFTQPDELRILSNTNGNGSMTSPRLRIWLKVTASETNFYHLTGGTANNTTLEPDDVLIWWNRGGADQAWTAHPTNRYRVPTPQMTP